MDERIDTVWGKIEGWAKRRDAGGTNHVALRKPLYVFMCNGCMHKLLSGVASSQLTLGA